jgi:hypothetical protein
MERSPHPSIPAAVVITAFNVLRHKSNINLSPPAQGMAAI